jgi:hypothetical protein
VHTAVAAREQDDRVSHRRTDVDVVRFVALASMYVAHVAPIPGPAHVLELSEYLTMPLFALLIGVGTELGARSAGPARQRWWSAAVRAAVLVVLGLALERAQAQVVIVLVHLGVLVVVAAVLVRLPTAAVLSTGLAVVVAERLLVDHVTIDAVAGGPWSDVAIFLWAGGPYRLLVMVLHAAVGIALSRWWLRGPRSGSAWLPGVVGAGLLVPAAAMLAAEQRGLLDLVPYSGTPQETLLDTLVAAGVFGVGLTAARVVHRSPPGRQVLVVLAAAGAMTLTLYTLQILWLAYDVRVLHPGSPDDSWTNLVVLLVGSVALAWAWPAVVRREPWRKGPLEGLVGASGRRSSPDPEGSLPLAR